METNPGARASLAETHISVVVFVGDRAYKLKKPVALGFLDFSTLAARRDACRREVELNRRFAPDVYLGTLTVADEDGRERDVLVEMRRMPEDRRLADLVAAGRVEDEDIAAIARIVAGVHLSEPPILDDPGLAAGTVLRDNWHQSFAQMAPHRGALFDAAVEARIEALADEYVAGREPLFLARAEAGWVRDGHGDLLAEDVFLLADGPRILDCIEFNDELRRGDVLLDIAFLAMDLERLGAPALADCLVRTWADLTGESHPPSLEHHFIAYRAHVRAKIGCLKAAQGDDAARPAIARHLAIARDHLERGRVRLALIGGLPGTGKSTIADALAEETAAVVIRSDEVRKELAGLPADRDAAAPLGEALYDREMTERTYAELTRRAGALLERGRSVILDASWSAAEHRDRARRAARDTASAMVELRCDAPRATLEQRLSRRADRYGSDAYPALVEPLAAAFEAWPEAQRLGTDRSVADAVAAARGAFSGTK